MFHDSCHALPCCNRICPSRSVYPCAAPWLNRRGITDLEGQVGRSGRPLKEVLKQTVNHAQAIKSGRPTTVLMDPAHLPRPVRLAACIGQA